MGLGVRLNTDWTDLKQATKKAQRGLGDGFHPTLRDETAKDGAPGLLRLVGRDFGQCGAVMTFLGWGRRDCSTVG
jgi:hypothetical protein